VLEGEAKGEGGEGSKPTPRSLAVGAGLMVFPFIMMWPLSCSFLLLVK
jgi:hypothetical protein